MPDIITNIGEVTDYEVFPGSAFRKKIGQILSATMIMKVSWSMHFV